MNEVMLSQLALRAKAHSPVLSDPQKIPQSEKSCLSENATHTCYKNTDTCKQTVQGCTVSKSTTAESDVYSDTPKKTSKPLLRPISDATVLNAGDDGDLVYLKENSGWSGPMNPTGVVGRVVGYYDKYDGEHLNITVYWGVGHGSNCYMAEDLWLVVK